MLRQLAAPLAAAARDGLNRGLAALVWTLVAVGLGITGFGLLLAVAIMGLSRLTGPLVACGLMGVALVLLALLVTALRHKRPVLAAPPPAPPLAPDHLAFAIGFVLARLILAKGS